MPRKVPAARERLDRLLVQRGLAESREQASRLILAGAVTVEGVVADKPARVIPVDAHLVLVPRQPAFVSRGGLKLAAALDAAGLDPAGLVAMDVGASTGGFTDCLLQRGAARVYAVDVGYGQLDWRLRHDPRVVVLERQNIRYLEPAVVPEPIDLAVIDVSFISLTTVLPCVLRFLSPSARVVALVKPQFEVGPKHVGRGGVVRNDAHRQMAVEHVLTAAATLGLVPMATLESPVPGQKGNREVLVILRRGERDDTRRPRGSAPVGDPTGQEAAP